ncbi:MAG: hemolysin family protein [Chlamydiae bacterium]|nr:hemolysin family protein [Chlamydiota bacterium]
MIDTPSWKLYLVLTGFFLLVQGCFSMLEMACVSFNKVRLQYFVSLNNRRAKWLSYLLSRPTLLFGVTLIGVNGALQLGSECSRRFYDSLGLSPDWAPISQILLVLIFAELTPMLAGRRYSEQIAMTGVPLLYFTSIIIRPAILFFDLLCKWINKLGKGPDRQQPFLSREELQFLFEAREGSRPSKEMNIIASHIFSLKNKQAKQVMIPLMNISMLPFFATVGEMRQFLTKSYVPYVPIYQRNIRDIIGIAYPRDLIRCDDNKRIKELIRPAWFISEDSQVFHILKQFRRNNQSIAVVLNEMGIAVGILTLDEVIDEIFGNLDDWESFEGIVPGKRQIIVDRSFPGDMEIALFNQKFHVHLDSKGARTLEELMVQTLGHPPELGETIRIDHFELRVEDAPLIGEKIISVKTML